MNSTEGFPPLLAHEPKVLILGSLPSRMSIELNEYYGNPRNAFWSIMGELFGAGPDLPYAQRTQRLTTAGVAVWDVLQASVRPGSLDASIEMETAMANDFDSFLTKHPGIRLIAFNGKKAASLFRKLAEPMLAMPATSADYLQLPSTSPAHAAMSFAAKLDCWSGITKFLQPEFNSGYAKRTATQKYTN